MSGGKIALIIFFILVVVWLILLTLGNLGLMKGSTQKYVKDRKWDKMRKMLEELHDADGTEDTTVCKDIRDWWEDNQEDYDTFIEEQEDGDPETLNDWAWGLPVEIKFKKFVEEYFKKVGKNFAEKDFLDIAKGNKKCENEVDLTKFKENVVRIIDSNPVSGYDPLTSDCSNVTSEQSVLPNYVWSYDDDTFIDISGLYDTEMGGSSWRDKYKIVCTPLAMDEEYVPASTVSGVTKPEHIKFTNVTNPVKGTKITIFGDDDTNSGLAYEFTSSTTSSFEIDIPTTKPLTRPLYTVKLNDKKTDHTFAGNVGTIALKTTTADDEAATVTTDKKTITFTPNIKIPVGYEIIVEATAVPESTICPTATVGKEIVAKMEASTTVIDENTVVELVRGVCYTKDDTKYTAGADTEYVPAEYTAYIRKQKDVSAASTDPENPKYKFTKFTIPTPSSSDNSASS